MKRFAIILLMLLATACSAGPNKGDVLVYVVAPLSGWQANGGQTVLGGARTMADQINRQGGLLGYKVVVNGLDDLADDDTATAQAQEIAGAIKQGKKVIGVIGHLNSGQTLAAMQVYKEFAAHRHHANRVRSVADQARISQLFPRQRD